MFEISQFQTPVLDGRTTTAILAISKETTVNILNFLIANTKNCLVFVPGTGDEEVLQILRRIPGVAPGDSERLPLGVVPGEETEESVCALRLLIELQGIEVVGPQPIYCDHRLTLFCLAQAIGSLLQQSLLKPPPTVAPPVVQLCNLNFLSGKEVLSLRIKDGKVVTEFHDIPATNDV